MKKPNTDLTINDYSIRLTKGALGAIPFVGGLLGEILDIAIYPKQQEKLNEWFEYIETTLNQLIKDKSKTKKEIFDDEEFLSIFQKTSRIYASNVEENKKPILKAYLKSSIKKKIPLDKKYIFLKIIDELTESQLMILKDINENEYSKEYLFKTKLEEKLSKKYTNNLSSIINTKLTDWFPVYQI